MAITRSFLRKIVVTSDPVAKPQQVKMAQRSGERLALVKTFQHKQMLYVNLSISVEKDFRD